MTEGAHQPAFTEPGGEQTRIPTAMVTVDDRLYLHFMSVHGFAEQGGVWSCNFSRFVYSDDAGASWHEAADDFGMRDAEINMLALTHERGAGNEAGSYVYALATPCGRFGGARAARVRIRRRPRSQRMAVPDSDHTRWRAHVGPGRRRRPRFVSPPVGEGSILWNPHLERWMFTSERACEGARTPRGGVPLGTLERAAHPGDGRRLPDALRGLHDTVVPAGRRADALLRHVHVRALQHLRDSSVPDAVTREVTPGSRSET